MRRRVTRRLIVAHAVCKSHQSFFRSMHQGEYLSKTPDLSCPIYGHPERVRHCTPITSTHSVGPDQIFDDCKTTWIRIRRRVTRRMRPLNEVLKADDSAMEVKVFSGVSDEAHPEVFNIEAMPSQPAEKKPGQLPKNTIRQFFEQGFVVIEDFFDKKDLDACREDVNELVDQLAQKLYKAGKIKDLYADKGLFERLTLVEKEFPGANIILHKYGRLPQSFKSLWTNERLLNVVEQLIGPNIAGHPVWNLRTKTPQNEATTVPWHQDCGYLDNDSYKVLQPTAWIPLLDANEHNGCMEVVRKGHSTGKIATHQCCYGNTWYVMLEEEEMEKTLGVDMAKDKVLCRVPYGGMLLLNNAIPHHSLPNISDSIRWSIDLRWQKPTLPSGFYGLKNCVLFRTEDNPNLEVDWDSFENVDRHSEAVKAIQDMADVIPAAEDNDFDTTITGPWMKKWEIVHVNRHVGQLAKEEGNVLTWHGHKN